ASYPPAPRPSADLYLPRTSAPPRVQEALPNRERHKCLWVVQGATRLRDNVLGPRRRVEGPPRTMAAPHLRTRPSLFAKESPVMAESDSWSWYNHICVAS